MVHKAIKKFPMKGQLRDDSDIPRLRTQYEQMLWHNMRDDGYIPVLDMGPLWSTSMRKDGSFDFELSVYGVYVGKEKACKLEGMDGTGKFHPRIHPSKSNQS